MHFFFCLIFRDGYFLRQRGLGMILSPQFLDGGYLKNPLSQYPL